MNTARKGIEAERFVTEWLEEREWLVASRRHIGGAGDLLAVNPHGDIWLIEVKACKNLWQNFTRADRQEMRETVLPEGGQRWVVQKKGKELIWMPESRWP